MATDAKQQLEAVKAQARKVIDALEARDVVEEAGLDDEDEDDVARLKEADAKLRREIEQLDNMLWRAEAVEAADG